jgi:hypothetical protein
VNTLEDRVRAAIRAAAEEISPRSLPPLSLAGRPAHHARAGSHGGHLGQGPRFLIPLLAAAAVIAIVVTAALVAPSGHAKLLQRAPANQPTTLSLQSVPRYYMTTVLYGAGTDAAGSYAVVRDTITGRTIATVQPPRPYTSFLGITGAADDRTFVLTAQTTDYGTPTPVKYFEARFDPASSTIALTALSLPGLPPSDDVPAAALSPDGTQLAVQDISGFTHLDQITVYSLPGGAARTWTGPVGGSLITETLSWSDTGILDFASAGTVYLLNTNSTGGSLLAHSQMALCLGPKAAGLESYTGYLTPDGTKIIAPVQQIVPIGQRLPCNGGPAPTPGPPAALEEFSATTAQAAGISGTRLSDGTVIWGSIYWSNSSGSVLIVNSKHGADPQQPFTTGVLSNGQFTPIPGTAGNWFLAF